MALERVVILRALGLGDLLTAVPALRALAEAFPHHERVLAAPLALAPLVALVCADDGAPAVHRVVDVRGLEPLPAELDKPAVAVNLHGRGPQSHRLLAELDPGRVLWFHCAEVSEGSPAPAWRAGEHEVARWCRMLCEHEVLADPARLEIAVPAGASGTRAEGATLIHPGTASGARRWPAERFAEVAAAELRESRRVVLTGGPGETRLCRAIAQRAGLDADALLAGRTDLAGLVRAVAGADRVVCGDTGVAHLATALGTPSVVLFGPTSPAAWGPPAALHRRHRVLWAGRTGDPHAAEPFEGLLEIEVSDVVEALADLPPRTRLAAVA